MSLKFRTREDPCLYQITHWIIACLNSVKFANRFCPCKLLRITLRCSSFKKHNLNESRYGQNILSCSSSHRLEPIGAWPRKGGGIKSILLRSSVLTRIFYIGVHRTHREAKRGSWGRKAGHNLDTWTLTYEIHIFELRIKIELCEDHRSEAVST